MSFKTRVSMIFVFGFIASASHAENLLDVYTLAAQRDPLLGQAQAQTELAKAGIPLARAAILPRVNLNASMSRHKLEMSGFSSSDTTTYYSGNNYGVTLQQPLLSGKYPPAKRIATYTLSSAETNQIAVRQSLIQRVVQAYFGLLKAQEDARIAKSEKERLDTLLTQAHVFLKAGNGDIIAVREAEARVKAAEAALISAESNQRIAAQAIFRLTQKPIDSVAGLGYIQAEGPQPPELSYWIGLAQQNPTLIAAQKQLDIAWEQTQVTRRERWPAVDLNAGYTYNKGGFTGAIESNDLYFGFNFSMPLYNGGETRAKVDQASARAENSRYQRDALLDETRFNTESAFARLQDSMARLQAIQDQLASTQTSLEAVRKGHEIGTRSNVDLLNAIQSMSSAERDLNNARHDHVLARMQLKYAAGVLDEAALEGLNKLLAK